MIYIILLYLFAGFCYLQLTDIEDFIESLFVIILWPVIVLFSISIELFDILIDKIKNILEKRGKR